jgi:hypothetical protein
MQRKFEVSPFSVNMRMPPEAVARCFEMDLKARDIRVLNLGDPMQPACLWPRPPGEDRKRTIWYWLDEVAGRVTPMSTGYDYDDLDGALAWTLTYLSRKVDGALVRLAPEEVAVEYILERYRGLVDAQRRDGQIGDSAKKNYNAGINRLLLYFADKRMIDVVRGGVNRYDDFAEARGHSKVSRQEDSTTLKRAINWVMQLEGSCFRVFWHVGEKQPADPCAFDPDEYLRILHVLETSERYNTNLEIVMVRDKKTGEMRPWTAPLKVQRARVPFTRYFPLTIDSATRPSVSIHSVWGPAKNRPNLHAASGLWVRNPLLKQETKEKKKGLCVLSPQMQAEAEAWEQEDIDLGAEYVIHDWRGGPVTTLSGSVWTTLLKHAQVRRRKLYAVKHTAVTIAATEGVTLQKMSQRFAVRAETLANVYSLQDDPRIQLDAAKAQGEKKLWFGNDAEMKARAARVAAAKAKRPKRAGDAPKHKTLPPPVPGRYAPRKHPGALVVAPTRVSALLSATLRTRGAVGGKSSAKPPGRKKPAKPSGGPKPADD